MGANSKIGWTHHTMNPWSGCQRVSPGCEHCYAEAMSDRWGSLGRWGPQGTRQVASETKWREPLTWERIARARGERHRVFCASLADVFEAWDGPMVDAKGNILHRGIDGDFRPIRGEGPSTLKMADVRARLADLIHDTPSLDWLLLTKRPENAGPMLRAMFGGNTPINVWLGVTAEDQERADERIAILRDVPGVLVRFVSFEPLLGPIDPHQCGAIYTDVDGDPRYDARVGDCPGIDWAIIGGESGPGRRPMELAWMESLASDLVRVGCPVFIKQDSAPREGQQGRISDDLWALKQFPEEF